MSCLPERYPDAPGFKVPGPSEQAAEAIAPIASNLRARVLTAISRAPAGLTADAVAARLNRSILSVRPRVAELHRQGLIRAAVARGKNASGMSASVWVVSPPLPGPDHGEDRT
jgi:hypothetical protein